MFNLLTLNEFINLGRWGKDTPSRGGYIVDFYSLAKLLQRYKVSRKQYKVINYNPAFNALVHHDIEGKVIGKKSLLHKRQEEHKINYIISNTGFNVQDLKTGDTHFVDIYHDLLPVLSGNIKEPDVNRIEDDILKHLKMNKTKELRAKFAYVMKLQTGPGKFFTHMDIMDDLLKHLKLDYLDIEYLTPEEENILMHRLNYWLTRAYIVTDVRKWIIKNRNPQVKYIS